MKLILHCILSFAPVFSIAQNVGIGTNNPQSQFSVGPNSEFRIEANGTISRINDVPYTFPNSQGARGAALVNSGNGALQWNIVSLPAGSIVMAEAPDTAFLVSNGFSVRGLSETIQRTLANSSGTYTPFQNFVSTVNGPPTGNMAVFGAGKMMIYSNNYVYLRDAATPVWTQSSLNTVPGYGPVTHSSTAVWTGTEMIVFGGFAGSPTNKGVRYNPVTNTWAAIADAPISMTSHTAVWTGAEMIACNASGIIYKYNLAANTWTGPHTIASIPLGHSNANAVWTGSRMIRTGGNTGEVAPNLITAYRECYAFDPASNTWSPLANMPYGMIYSRAVWTGTNIIVMGNHYSSKTGATYFLVLSYDPQNNTWTQLANEGAHPAATNNPEIAWTGSEILLHTLAASQNFSPAGFGYSVDMPTLQPFYLMKKIL